MDAPDLTLTEARRELARRDLGAEELTRACLERIDALDGRLGCFLQRFDDAAIDAARAADERLGRGEDLGPLGGLPLALKDNICLDAGRTTCASRMLERYASPFSATAAARLLDAGAIVLGKTNLDEFAMGSSGEHSAFGPTRNPWDETRVPGGSSAGSAAAVAARMVPGALGSDTGGSIRQPAAYCGVVGLKPTYGRVSRYGLVAFASSLDQIGPFGRCVADCALMLGVIAGVDAHDSTSADVAVGAYEAALEEQALGLRIGVPAEARSPGNHPGVNEAFDAAVDAFRSLGAQIVDVELPNLEHGIAAYYLVAPAEASSNLARYDGVRYGHRAGPVPGEDLFDLYARSRSEGFGAEVQRRIMLGTYALSSGYYDAYYLTALKVRRRIKEDFDAVFSAAGGGAGCHAVILPSAPTPAFSIGAMTADPLTMYQQDLYTIPANMAGLPALSAPMGFVSEGAKALPVGLQIVAPAFEEERLLRIARMYERATRFGERAPDVCRS